MLLVNPSAPVLRDRELLDLDIANVLCAVDGSFGKEEALAFVKSFFTADKTELSERSAVLADMASCPVDRFADALSALRALPEENGKFKRSITRVDEVLYLLRRAKTYLKALDAFSALMRPLKSPSRHLRRRERPPARGRLRDRKTPRIPPLFLRRRQRQGRRHAHRIRIHRPGLYGQSLKLPPGGR